MEKFGCLQPLEKMLKLQLRLSLSPVPDGAREWSRAFGSRFEAIPKALFYALSEILLNLADASEKITRVCQIS